MCGCCGAPAHAPRDAERRPFFGCAGVQRPNTVPCAACEYRWGCVQRAIAAARAVQGEENECMSARVATFGSWGGMRGDGGGMEGGWDRARAWAGVVVEGPRGGARNKRGCKAGIPRARHGSGGRAAAEARGAEGGGAGWPLSRRGGGAPAGWPLRLRWRGAAPADLSLVWTFGSTLGVPGLDARRGDPSLRPALTQPTALSCLGFSLQLCLALACVLPWLQPQSP